MAAELQRPLSDRVRNFFRGGIDSLYQEKIEFQESSYQTHFVRSKEMIAEAIQGLGKTALILGAGGCNDIPLERLAEKFDRIVLVDGCADHAKGAVGELDPKYRGKFVFQEADLTGMFDSFAAEVDQIGSKRLSFEEFIEGCCQILLKLKRTQHYDYQKERASFVCSSLVNSQLGANLMEMLDQISWLYYGRLFEIPPGWEDKIKSLISFIETEHVAELHRLVEQEGKVYFADTLSVEERAAESAPKIGKMAGGGKVIDCTVKHFRGFQKRWNWVQHAPELSLTRIFHVTAFILNPK